MRDQIDKTKELIRKSMRDFARNELAPLGRELDENAEFPFEIYKKTVPLGLLDMTLPIELGGSSMDFQSFLIALEEFAKANAGVANVIAQTELFLYIIQHYGNSNLHKAYIQKAVQGEIFASVLADGTYVKFDKCPVDAKYISDRIELNGLITSMPNIHIADVAIIFAQNDEIGLSVFVVEKETEGITLGQQAELMGQRSFSFCDMHFKNVKVTKNERIGDDHNGIDIYKDITNRMRVASAAISVGISQAALEESTRHAKQRNQFGKPISQFEETQNKIADIALGIEAARSLVRNAASLLDKKQKPDKLCAISKVFASELAAQTSKEAVQIHGGYGYIKDYTVERLYRDALLCDFFPGNNEMLRYQIAEKIYNEIV